MQVTNFLPDDYLTRCGARRANWVCLGIAAGTLLLLGAAVAFVLVRSWAMVGMRFIVEAQYQEASRQIEDLEQLEQHKAGLLRKVELSTDLLERVPRSHVLARLTNHLPEHTSLTSMTMQVEQMKVPVDSTADGTAPPATAKRTKGRAGKKQPRVIRVKRVRFRLDGLAETDVEVAEYISRLHTDPLFETVDLQFSEAFPYQEGVTMRRFQMSFLLSEDADKTLESFGTEPPAVADSAPTAKEGNS
jgi:Tfp pilus assembly protein PilN